MPVIKIDLIFRAVKNGWRETYYRFFGDGDTSLNDIVQQLAEKRIALSGYPVAIEAYTWQDPLTPGRQGQSVYINPPLVGTGATSDIGSVAPGAAINVEFFNFSTTRSRRIWVRGVWDAAVTDYNDLRNAQYAAWNSKFQQWRSFLLFHQFGWIMRPRDGAHVEVEYDYEDGSTVPVFRFPPSTWDPATFGVPQNVRFSKFNGSRSPLNRELIIVPWDHETAYAQLPIAAGPMQNNGMMIRYGTPEFIVANNIGIERVGRRNPGRPLLVTPGRQSNRPRS